MPSTDTELELRAFRAHAPAQQALRSLLYAVQSTNADAFYAVRTRVKPVTKTIEKVHIKRTHPKNPKPTYEPENITDIVGIRIVTLFREDVIDALKIFLKMIKHEEMFAANSPFVKGELQEKIVYATAAASDPEAIISRLRTAFENNGFPLEQNDVQQTETGYSSVHLVAFCSVPQEGATARVPVEIQIRTVFEDAWGEIDHKLRYSKDRRRGLGAEKLLENWQPHLNVLKSFTDGCAQYAGVIKSQAIDASGGANFSGPPFVPVDSVVDTIKQIGQVSEDLQTAFQAAYGAREAASKLQADGQGQPTEKIEKAFLEASQLFEDAYKLCESDGFESTRARAAAMFFSKMEKAFCLLSIRKKSFTAQAIEIYREMREKSPGSAVIYYRYAQALSSLNEIDAAVAMYQKADTIVEDDKHVPKDHWLRSLIPRNLGFLLWVKSSQCEETDEGRKARLNLLLEAYNCTERSLSLPVSEKNRTRCINNLLFYSIEYRCIRLATDPEQIGEDKGRHYLREFERLVSIGTAPKSQIFWLDTLCRAYVAFERFDDAVLVAERIEHILSVPGEGEGGDVGTPASLRSYYAITDHLNESERDILDHALWVLRNHGPGPEPGNGSG